MVFLCQLVHSRVAVDGLGVAFQGPDVLSRHHFLRGLLIGIGLAATTNSNRTLGNKVELAPFVIRGMAIDCSSIGEGALFSHAFAMAEDDKLALRTGGYCVAACSSDTHIAAAVASVLTVQKRADEEGGVCTHVFDLEFSDEIDAVSFDCTGDCVIVGDCKHTLHFVTMDGVLIFSHKIKPVDTDALCAQFLYIGLLKMSAESEQQCLLALLSDGSIVGIADVPVKGIASMAKARPSAAVLAGAIKKLHFLKSQISASDVSLPLQKAALFSVGLCGELAAVFIDSSNSLRFASVGSTSALSADTPPLPCNDCGALCMDCSDFVLLDSSLLGVLSKSPSPNPNQLSLLDASNPAEVVELYSVQLDTTFDQIGLSASAGDAKVFILSSSADHRATMYCIHCCADQATPPQLLLLGRCWSGGSVLFDNFNSRNSIIIDAAGSAIVAKEVSPAIISGLSDASSGAASLGSSLGVCSSMQLVCSLLRSPTLSAEQKLLAVRAAPSPLLIALFGAVLAAPQPEDGFLRALLSACEDAAHGSSSSSSYFSGMSQVLCWVEQTASQGEEARRVALRQLSSAKGRLDAWRAAVIAGAFDSASALHRAMRACCDERLDERASVLLDILSRAAQPCCDLDGLVLVVSQRRAALLAEQSVRAAVLLKIAARLCDAARASEDYSGDPFAAAAAAELAASLVMAARADDVVTADQLQQAAEQVASLRRALRMQIAVRLRWGARASLRDLSSGGLSSLVYQRLCAVPEIALPADIRDRIAPLVQEFGPADALDTDDLLLSWIQDSVQNRVITNGSGGGEETDSSGDGDSDDDRDCESSSSVPRLVAVADLIGAPDKKARAVLLLLQLPNLEAAVVGSCSPQLPCAQHLRAAAETLLAAGPGPLHEQLQETLKLLAARAIARRYGICSVDLRDSLQVRSALLLISSKTHTAAGALCDAVDFAQACGASRSDVCALLTRCIVHRAAGSLSDSALAADAVREAMQALPGPGLADAAEDACSCLLGELEEACEEDDAAAAAAACEGALMVGSTFIEEQSGCGSSRGGSWLTASLLAELRRLRALQAGHGLLLSLPQLRSPHHCRDVVAALALAAVQSSSASPKPSPELRRVCDLLVVPPAFAVLASVKLLMARGSGGEAQAAARQLLSSGSLDYSCAEDTLLAVELAVLLSSPSSKQLPGTACDGQALALVGELLRGAATACAEGSLPRVTDLLVATDLVAAVSRRIESASPRPILAPRVPEPVLACDGMLMSAQAATGPLMRFALRELHRRRGFCPSSGSSAAPSPSHGSDDVDELVTLLQGSENHMLAARVLHTTWSRSASSRGQQAHTSLRSLCRRTLAHRSVDIPLAVAALAGLPYETMVRELKSAVPSIQSDFSRLRTVAAVGEELARAWGAAQLLDVFQGLRTNARWWHVLASLGVRIDARAFQSSDVQQRDECIRAVVPQLLGSGVGLDKAEEYCRQFDIEGDFASVCYLDMLLLQPPTQQGTDAAWIGLVHRSASRLDGSALLALLRRTVRRLHPLDYGRVRFVSAWLRGLLGEEEGEGEGGCGATVVGAIARPNPNLEELQELRRVADIATFLTALQLPPAVAAWLPDSLAGRYAEAPDSHRRRLPLWPLLDDPWGVLEAVMSAAPAALLEKLAPLCAPLGLSTDDFYVRCIGVCIGKMTEQQLQTALSMVACPLKQIEAWNAIFSFEQQRGDLAAAARALVAALAVSEAALRLQKGSGDLWADLETARLEMTHELVTLRSGFVVAALQDLTATANAQAGLPAPPAAPAGCYARSTMFQCCFGIMLEAAWELQLAHLCSTGSVLCVEDVSSRTLQPAVEAYLRSAGALLRELEASRALLPSAGAPVGDENALPVGGADGKAGCGSPLEACRQGLVGRALADVDSAAILSANSSSSRSGKSARVASRGGRAVCGALARAGTAAFGASARDLRRRRDCYLSFHLCALLASSAAPAVGAEQLDALARGRAARSIRRLTARSKLRAAQALRFLPLSMWQVGSELPLEAASGTAGSAQLLTMSLAQLCCYYRCLADVQELHVACSEDTLLAALLDGLGSSALALVRTWLHDEGELQGVVVLSYEVLLAAKQTCRRTWAALLQHMLSQKLHGTVIEAVCAARGGVCLAAMLDEGGGSVGVALREGLTEAATRARALAAGPATAAAWEEGFSGGGASLAPRLPLRWGGVGAEDLVLLAEQARCCSSLLREHGAAAGDFSVALGLLEATSAADGEAAAVMDALSSCATSICVGHLESAGGAGGEHEAQQLFIAAGARSWSLFASVCDRLGRARARAVLSCPWLTRELLAALLLDAARSWSCGSAARSAAGLLLAWCADAVEGPEGEKVAGAAALLDRESWRALGAGAEVLLPRARRAGLLAAMQHAAAELA